MQFEGARATLRRILNVLKKTGLAALGLVGAYLVAAVTLSYLTWPVDEPVCEQTVTIYLQHSDVHADFVLPTARLSEDFRADITLAGGAPYVLVGLGDRDVFLNTPTWTDMNAGHAAKALFWPSRRAIHIAPYYSVYDHWVPVEICRSGLDRLQTYIQNSFDRRPDGKTRIIAGASYSGNDGFFEAGGRYTAFNTCNNWTNGGLKAAGRKTSIWSPFLQGLLHHAKK